MRPSSTKSIIFKTIFLVCSLAVFGYTVYLMIDHIVFGFQNEIDFDDFIVMFSTVFALLFEGSMVGFVIRSFNAPTLIMKNLVFKPDGSAYRVGIFSVLAGIVICGAMFVLFTVSAYAHSVIDIPHRAQCFIADVFLILFVNFAFVDLYYLTFRHESGTFEII